jgi:HSP20 family molecular chaperone IbpA
MKVDEMPRIYLVESRTDDRPQNPYDTDFGQPQPWSIVRQAQVWQPPTDVFEFPDRLIVRVEVAGMRDGLFHVSLHDRKLSISGTRARVTQERSALQYHRMEIGYGEFRVEVSLPWPVGRSQATAVYRDGFLLVELPQAPNQQMYVVDVDQSLDPLETSDIADAFDQADTSIPPVPPTQKTDTPA